MQNSIARVIVNTDAVNELCETLAKEHPNLKKWLDTIFKKWVLLKAPATPSILQTTTGLPAWLKKDTVQVDIDNIRELITPVIDYFENMLQERPSYNFNQVGVDAAIAASEKWHRALIARRKKVQVIEGEKTVKEYPNGFSWVQLFGIAALERESVRMANCIGGGYHHKQVLLKDLEIFSLRDALNEPHVTCDANGLLFNQIQGYNNKAVDAKWLPYVFDFLTSKPWKSIPWAKIEPLKDQWLAWKKEHSPIFEGIRVYSLGEDLDYRIIVEKEGKSAEYSLYQFPRAPDEIVWAISKFLEKDLPCKNLQPLQLPALSSFKIVKNEGIAWYKADCRGSQEFMHYVGGNAASLICIEKTLQTWLALANDNGIWFTGQYVASNINKANEIYASCPIYDKGMKVYNADMQELPFETTRFQQLHIGHAVTQSSHAINGLLEALHQPSFEQLEQSCTLSPSDSTYKSIGLPTGGTSMTAFGIVIAACLNNNLAAAAIYVANKPHALRNWVGVLNHEDNDTFRRVGLAASAQRPLYEQLDTLYNKLVPFMPHTIANQVKNERPDN